MQFQAVQQLNLLQRIAIRGLFRLFRRCQSFPALRPIQGSSWFSLPNESHGIDRRKLSQCLFYPIILTLYHYRLHPFACQYRFHARSCQLIQYRRRNGPIIRLNRDPHPLSAGNRLRRQKGLRLIHTIPRLSLRIQIDPETIAGRGHTLKNRNQ